MWSWMSYSYATLRFQLKFRRISTVWNYFGEYCKRAVCWLKLHRISWFFFSLKKILVFEIQGDLVLHDQVHAKTLVSTDSFLIIWDLVESITQICEYLCRVAFSRVTRFPSVSIKLLFALMFWMVFFFTRITDQNKSKISRFLLYGFLFMC